MNKDPIKCVVCGQFVSYAEMEEGGGARHYFIPDNAFGNEQSEWTCAICVEEARTDCYGFN